MKTFSISTLGCKVNQYESQQIRELLERLGLIQVEIPQEKPDLVVINTCCVTHTASAKSRQSIRKAQKLSPDVIIVCGCLPSVEIDELNNIPGDNVHFITNRNNLAEILSHIASGKTGNGSKANDSNNLANHLGLAPIKSFKSHTRAFLKIQDGCDGYCSYCIIPKTRPFLDSKPAETVIKEAKALVEAGHKEIVVTGVFLGAYGQSSVRRQKWMNQQNDKLAELLEKLVEIPNLARIRLSSLEPADVTQRLLDTFCRHRNIMPHLHLSLQSGSDAILEKMCRQYRAGEFQRAVELIKSQLDRPAITADIIVGFPGETDADFEQTVALAKEAGFAKMHVFSFSRRKGTDAAKMQALVNKRVIKERVKVLSDLNCELGRKFRQQFIGETATILMENGGGRSERYFMVYLENADNRPEKGELVRVKLVRNNENGVIGEVKARQDTQVGARNVGKLAKTMEKQVETLENCGKRGRNF